MQIEARPTLRQAQDRARAYANAFSNVAGFQLRSGWYAIALGPFTAEGAANQLQALRRERLIPSDSYLSDGATFQQQFWPIGATARVTPVEPAPTIVQPTALPDETPAQARRAERDLTREERMELQEALKWEGFYTAAIDGSFGPGTRNAMAAYQAAMAYDPTGVLTTKQRQALMKGYRDAFASLGLRTVDDSKAGISVTMPTGMVEFARYEPPFAHYDNTANNGVRVLLISQTGDQNTLFGLYDIMQTLEIVPLNGARERNKRSFVLTGQNDELHSYTYAALANGMVKGFTLTWRPEDEKLMNRAAQIMRDSFEPFGDRALDDTIGEASPEQSIDLMSGLEIRRADVARTGFYVDGQGTVLTTSEVLDQCQRLTIADEYDAEIAAVDETLGLAVLRPNEPLAPIAYAAFQTGVPRLQSDVAVAGFSYGDALDLPVLTYGKLADLRGLSGEDGINRLALNTLPGDAGGPVFDATGAVMGVLLTKDQGSRKLPDDVNFAANVPTVAGFLSASGVPMAASDNSGPMDPVDLTTFASDMAVLVSCWK
ncbi:serine protease [Actibacterium lipolyticum]|uniref:serine protease n=1 Tax=Actibacterium lipolyticum TaxID=1524263 RepID=UPI001F179852|nr:serine protease [Actibacterium lipolyticum]